MWESRFWGAFCLALWASIAWKSMWVFPSPPPPSQNKTTRPSEVGPTLQDAFFFPTRSIREASARQHQARCSAQTGRCKLLYAGCTVQVARRKLLRASCSVQVGPCKWLPASCSAQIAPCKLLPASCSLQAALCKLLCASCSA